MEKISVAVRFRPPNPTPTPAGASSTSSGGGDREWRIEDARVSLLHRGAHVPAASFTFDHVFDGEATNAQVYGALVRSVIRAAVDGFNGTVFAYGQTSSGKTYTMSGSDADPGIIPLAVRDLFDTACQAVDRELVFKVSYMELYNEDINDLLMLGSQKLPIRDNLEREACVCGLREEVVESAEQALELLKLGEANRHFGETNMNARSSRSHTIFRMIIESRAKNQIDSRDAIRVSILNLVDLAGSERNSKTGAQGVRLEEGKHINESLMHLGIVINKLSENGKQIGHIPYRNSKLTRILESALGGNAKTSIVCTAAPEEIHIDETKGTLQFASRAKCVSNCAQVNEILTDAALVKRQKLEIKELRKRLQHSDSEAMKQVVLKQSDELRRCELERNQLAMELEQERKLRETLEDRLNGEKKTLEALNRTSTSSDQITNSIQAAPSEEPTDARWQRLEQNCISDRQALETELALLRNESSLLLQELTRSKEEAARAIAEKQELLKDLSTRCARPEKDCSAGQQALETELALLREELSRSKEEACRAAAEKQELLRDLGARCARTEKDCSAGQQALETELALLREELSRSKEEACHAAAEKQELLGELGARCPRPEKECSAERQAAEEENNLLCEENSCLQLEASRARREGARLAAEVRARLEEALARCAALGEERSALARELDGGSARCGALEEELAGSRPEAARLAAENRELVEELEAEKRRGRKAEEWAAAAAAREQADVAREEQVSRLLAKAKALVAVAHRKAASVNLVAVP